MRWLAVHYILIQTNPSLSLQRVLEPEGSGPSAFDRYRVEFKKSYAKEGELQYREAVFLKNLAEIQRHNADPEQTYAKGVNQFTDLTQAEFEAIYLTLKINNKFEGDALLRTFDDAAVNADIDWSAAGDVTAVKNQGQCGSCWAFSAVGAIESAYLIKSQTSLNLAEQQLVDCSRSYGNQGCNGGWMDSAFSYVIDHGLTTTAKYPYVARDQACKSDDGEYKITTFIDAPGCDGLLNSLTVTPISVAVDASNWSAYRTGIFSNCATNVNHGVLLVGRSDSYWRIKNSWGTNWGESGYVRLVVGNTCAVCNYPSYPII